MSEFMIDQKKLIDRHVGNRIRILRERNNISAEEMSSKLKMTSLEYMRCEDGAARFTIENLTNGAMLNGVSVTWFFEGLVSAMATVTHNSDLDKGESAEVVVFKSNKDI